MTKRDYQITDTAKGTALALRIVAGAECDEVGEIFSDGTVEIRLTAPAEEDLNVAVIQFFADFLGIWPSDIEVLAGHDGLKKLVTIVNIASSDVEQKLFEAASHDEC